MNNSAVDIAKYVITRCDESGNNISNLHLQKILYFLQKTALQEFGEVLFSDGIEAWQHGPVVRDVYRRFRGYGAKPIVMTYDDLNIEFNNKSGNSCKVRLDEEIERLSGIDPWELVDMTHVSGGAWGETFREGAGMYAYISIDRISKEE